jgi:hypothetical protein
MAASADSRERHPRAGLRHAGFRERGGGQQLVPAGRGRLVAVDGRNPGALEQAERIEPARRAERALEHHVRAMGKGMRRRRPGSTSVSSFTTVISARGASSACSSSFSSTRMREAITATVGVVILAPILLFLGCKFELQRVQADDFQVRAAGRRTGTISRLHRVAQGNGSFTSRGR